MIELDLARPPSLVPPSDLWGSNGATIGGFDATRRGSFNDRLLQKKVFNGAAGSTVITEEEDSLVLPAMLATSPQSTSPKREKMVYKLVLTGGPCGGKTTGQDRVASFFEHLGWKVYRVPETATLLLGGGVKFAELSREQAMVFQEDLLLTLIQIEDVYFHQARMVKSQNVLVICDRGAMDPSAYIDAETWQRTMEKHKWNSVDLRDNRYNQVVHMVTAADGAEKYYTQQNNKTRSEGIQAAISQDETTRKVRIRKRGQKGHWSYTITTRHALVENEPPVETRMPVSKREYERYRQMRDPQRVTLCKRRRCFNFGSQYFHLDIYVRPLPPSCGGKPLTFLETYTTSQQGDATELRLPEFIIVDREITGDPAYSMFNLSKMKAAPSALHNGRHNDNTTPLS